MTRVSHPMSRGCIRVGRSEMRQSGSPPPEMRVYYFWRIFPGGVHARNGEMTPS